MWESFMSPLSPACIPPASQCAPPSLQQVAAIAPVWALSVPQSGSAAAVTLTQHSANAQLLITSRD